MWEIKKDIDLTVQFKQIPAGKHRVRIENVEPVVSQKTGLKMFKLTLEVSGETSKLFNYVVFDDRDEAAKQRTVQALARIGNSFNIDAGQVNPEQVPFTWFGKAGGVMVKHEIYEGNPSAKVAYFLLRDEVEKLPLWAGAATSVDDSIPF